MKKLLITLLILMVAVAARAGHYNQGDLGVKVSIDPALPAGMIAFATSSEINVAGIKFGIKELTDMGKEEVVNLIHLMYYYKLGIWMSDEFNMEMNRKLLPRFFKKEPEK